MDWLTAALAFATTMLFFALVVSSLVEMIHRFFGLRERGLKLMLESFHDQVLSGYLKRAGASSTLSASEFADAIMANRAVSTTSADGTHLEASQSLSARLVRWLSATTVTNVPVELFAQKLAEKVSFVDNGTTAIMQDISQKYVAFGSEASEYFRRRARLFSVIVAFPVAFLFYVQPYDLAQAFLRDRALAQKIAEHNVGLLRLPESAPGATGGADAPATSGTAPGATGEASETSSAGDQEIARLKQEIAALREGFQRWDAAGLPVGWPDKLGMPKCSESAEPGGIWKSGCTRTLPLVGDLAIPGLAQLFWLCVGALLVGLGAPFWAQAVGALTASKGAVEKISTIVDGADSRSTVLAAAPATVAPKASTSVRSYEVTQAAKKIGAGRAGI